MYPIFFSNIFLLMISILIFFLFKLNSNSFFVDGLYIVKRTLVPGFPLISSIAFSLDISFVSFSSILIILSPGKIPALYAGVPIIGAITVSSLFCIFNLNPTPPNDPFNPLLTLLYSFSVIYLE